jgi:hypothetical protein
VVNQNTREDNWRCDVCLSKENEEDDPLCICELCLVVVHPSCYRRDLYEQDPEDENPWFCARCNYILTAQQDNGRTLSKEKLPKCMLCHDLSGAMVDLESKEWVHHVCVNWHNEIWFEEDDNKIRSFGGTLDFERFNLKCTICQE